MRLFSRRPRGDEPADPRITEQRSPGLETLAEHLDRCRQPAVLDFGPSTTDSLRLLGGIAASVEVVDLFHSVGGTDGERADRFQLPPVETMPLPPEGAFDALLLWDLPLYLRRGDLAPLVERIRPLCRPGAVLFMLVTTVLPLSPVPLRFRILGRGRLAYAPPSPGYDPSRRLMPREIENTLTGFSPLHYYQLKNGLKEMLFSRDEHQDE